MNDGIDNSLGAEWDELSLELYRKRSPEQGSSASIAHRAFHHGALAALLCLHRGAKFEDLLAEALVACRAPAVRRSD
jgi:hypothetical protein